MKDTSRPLSAAYQCYKHELKGDRRRWLVTGGAGFIGSNLVEMLLLHDQDVVILDNLATGHRRNLVEVEEIVGPVRWSRCNFIQGDIRDLDTCRVAVAGVQHVLHQAALGSVPRSLNDPLTSNEVNVSGFLNMLVAARDAHVDSFVYAASSSTYGDHEALPKVEDRIGRPLSPYAATKLVNEIYSDVFRRCYGFRATGLRYFNVFGRRQDPNGAYAAVIPKWTASLLERRPVHINGDGHTSRDFCYVENVVQANILAALTPDEASGQIYNIAGGNRMDLNTLYKSLCAALAGLGFQTSSPLIYQDFRPGDVRHSLADISKAQHMLDYRPSHDVQHGLSEAMPWYVDFLSRQLPELEKA